VNGEKISLVDTFLDNHGELIAPHRHVCYTVETNLFLGVRMFDQSVKRVGWACKYLHPVQSLSRRKLDEIQKPLNTRGTTLQWLSRQPKFVAVQRMTDIMRHNIDSFMNIMKFVATEPPERRMVRLSSDCLPMYTHEDWKWFWQQPDIRDYCERHFAEVGELAREHDIRLSMHPGQFCVLGSDRPDVVQRSIEEFEYHVDMIRWMGFGKEFQDFKCNVHISCRLGPDGVRDAFKKLSPEAKNVITIENDENRWGLDHSLELSDICALVVDVHHYWCREGDYLKLHDPRVQQVIDSWRGARPTMHYSLSRENIIGNFTNGRPDMQTLNESGLTKSKLRAHSNMMWSPCVNMYVRDFWEYFDVMVEAKNKNLASKQLHEEFKVA